VLNRPDFVEAAPTLLGDPRLGLPPASPHRYDGREMAVSHLHPTHNSASWRSSGPFTPRAAIATAKVKAVIASNLPFGSNGLSCRASPAHLLTSARFRARAPGPVSGQLRRASRRSTGQDGAGFLLPFGRRPPLLEASCPARGFRPSYDRPTTPPADGPDPSGVPCSARVRHGWGRVPSLPRGPRCLPRPGNLPDRRVPPSNGRSLFTPVPHSRPGMYL